MNKYLTALLIAALFVVSPPSVQALSAPVDSVDMWVFFAPSEAAAPVRHHSKRALQRRSAVGMNSVDAAAEHGPSPQAINQIRAHGARLRHSSRWLNAASFRIPRAALTGVKSLSGVIRLEPVGCYARAERGEATLRKARPVDVQSYGHAITPLEQLQIPQTHDLIRLSRGQTPGQGVLIALFDADFFLGHRCFERLKNEQRIVGDSDFVDRARLAGQFDGFGESHGATVLSLLAAYSPGLYVGAAWGAQFLLARTEDASGERHVEEDNWVAALEWAEAMGADIVSSSLGYRYDFDEPDGDYGHEQLDGATLPISIAARMAAQRGMVIVNAAGNDADLAPQSSTINAPADAPGVIAVGAIDEFGVRASFSSYGPTADGRIKPDVAAPGVNLLLPNTATGELNYSSSGTSLSTPLVSAVCALIVQCHPGLDAAGIRSRLIASCQLAPGQSAPDNLFGYGIPQAFTGCADSTQLLVRVESSAGVPLQGALWLKGSAQPSSRTDARGTALLHLSAAALPALVQVDLDKGERAVCSVTTVPGVVDVRFENQVWVRMTNREGQALRQGSLYWRYRGEKQFTKVEYQGEALLPLNYFAPRDGELYGAGAGFLDGDTLQIASSTLPCTLSVTLEPFSTERLDVFPTVVSANKTGESITILFGAQQGGSSFSAMLRTLNGEVVWQHHQFYQPSVVQVDLPCRTPAGGPLAPGMYYLMVRYNNHQAIRKILVKGSLSL